MVTLHSSNYRSELHQTGIRTLVQEREVETKLQSVIGVCQ
jgi:hypothetical protein